MLVDRGADQIGELPQGRIYTLRTIIQYVWNGFLGWGVADMTLSR